MPQSLADAAFDEFLAQYRRVPEERRGMARHIAAVALLEIAHNEGSIEHWLEHSVERFRSSSDMAYMTFAKTASIARALVRYGTVDGVQLTSTIDQLAQSENPLTTAELLVQKVNVNDALRRRAWRKTLGVASVEGLAVLQQVEELLIRAEAGDGLAAAELRAIRDILEIERAAAPTR